MPGKHGSWTVLFEDRKILKKCEDFSPGNHAEVDLSDDDAFWNQEKFNGVNAIQFTNDNVDNDQVETDTANVPYLAATYGSFQQFVDKFDAAHLINIQNQWDADNLENETPEEKIARLGARPTSYSSTPIQ